MEESVRKNVADVDVRMQSALIYDYFTYGSLPCKDILYAWFVIYERGGGSNFFLSSNGRPYILAYDRLVLDLMKLVARPCTVCGSQKMRDARHLFGLVTACA